jgi:hypothetical protein
MDCWLTLLTQPRIHANKRGSELADRVDQTIDLFFGRVTGAARANQSLGFEAETFNDSRGVEVDV